MINSVKDALATWKSDTANGEVDATAIGNKFKEYFKVIGTVWNTEFGQWIAEF